jgi:hypothetical protein
MKPNGILSDTYKDCFGLVPGSYEVAIIDGQGVPASCNGPGLIDDVAPPHADDPKFVMGHCFAAMVNANERHLAGSYAQRDVIDWIVVEPTLRARRIKLGLGLVNGGIQLRPTSRHNLRLTDRALREIGDIARAERTKSYAHSTSQD